MTSKLENVEWVLFDVENPKKDHDKLSLNYGKGPHYDAKGLRLYREKRVTLQLKRGGVTLNWLFSRSEAEDFIKMFEDLISHSGSDCACKGQAENNM